MTTREWIALAGLILSLIASLGATVAFFLQREKALWAHINKLRSDLAVMQSIIDRTPDWSAKFEKLDDKIDDIGTRIDHLVVTLNGSFARCPNHSVDSRPPTIQEHRHPWGGKIPVTAD